MSVLVKDMTGFEKKNQLQQNFLEGQKFFNEGMRFSEPDYFFFKKMRVGVTIRSIYTNKVITLDNECVFHVEEISESILPRETYQPSFQPSFQSYFLAAIRDKIYEMFKEGNESDFSIMMRSQIQLVGLLYDSEEPEIYFQIIFRDEDFEEFFSLLKPAYDQTEISEAKICVAYKPYLIEVTERSE